MGSTESERKERKCTSVVSKFAGSTFFSTFPSSLMFPAEGRTIVLTGPDFHSRKNGMAAKWPGLVLSNNILHKTSISTIPNKESSNVG